MMRRALHTATLLVLGVLSAACHFRPLEDPSNVSYVRVYVDERDLLNVKEGFYNPAFAHPLYKRPEIMHVSLFDPATGALVTDRYLRNHGEDERGFYFDGYVVVNPGTYHLAVYNFGTESTVVDGEYNWQDLSASTHLVSTSLTALYSKDGETRAVDGPVRYDADLLFVASEQEVTVHSHQHADTLRQADGTPWFTASSVVKDYYLQIGVKGAQYIRTSVGILGGMASSVKLSSKAYLDAAPTSLFMEMNTGAYPEEDRQCLYATFGTFGRLDTQENQLQLSFELVTTYGSTFEVSLEIYPEFLKPDAVNHRWLIIDKVITIPDPPDGGEGAGGGLAPSVEDWGNVESEIII